MPGTRPIAAAVFTRVGPVILTARSSNGSTTRQIAAFFETYDVLISPTIAHPPPKTGYILSDLDDIEEIIGRLFPFTPFTGIFNLTGQPAMSLPLYWDSDGLPIGIQVAARYAEEALLFRLAGQLEKERPWIDKRPPIYT